MPQFLYLGRLPPRYAVTPSQTGTRLWQIYVTSALQQRVGSWCHPSFRGRRPDHPELLMEDASFDYGKGFVPGSCPGTPLVQENSLVAFEARKRIPPKGFPPLGHLGPTTEVEHRHLRGHRLVKAPNSCAPSSCKESLRHHTVRARYGL